MLIEVEKQKTKISFELLESMVSYGKLIIDNT